MIPDGNSDPQEWMNERMASEMANSWANIKEGKKGCLLNSE